MNADKRRGETTLLVTVAMARPANPFHRVLGRVLETFPPGRRPELEELTRRLCIGEPAFLAQAWSELVAWRASDADDFGAARLSRAGEESLRRGWFAVGEKTTRRVTLVLARDEVLDAGRIEAELTRLGGKDGLAPGERVLAFEFTPRAGG
jgi:hypothetical protein